jgi:hypothetical protein
MTILHEKRTPRIIAVFRKGNDASRFDVFMKTHSSLSTKQVHVEGLEPCDMVYIQTYNGRVEDYMPFEVGFNQYFHPESTTPQGMAEELYDMTDYFDEKYDDLRVCTIAGIRDGNGPGGWNIWIRNRHSRPPPKFHHIFIDL